MPLYILKCTHCNKEKEVFCRIDDRYSYTCTCGGKMRVKITPVYHLFKGVRTRVQKWMKERGL